MSLSPFASHKKRLISVIDKRDIFMFARLINDYYYYYYIIIIMNKTAKQTASMSANRLSMFKDLNRFLYIVSIGPYW